MTNEESIFYSYYEWYNGTDGDSYMGTCNGTGDSTPDSLEGLKEEMPYGE